MCGPGHQRSGVSMSQKTPKPLVTLSQMEEALEERVNPDRRKANLGLPASVSVDRRKGDRRGNKKARQD